MANILVVDDDTAVQQTIKILLDMSGHDATAVGDGRTALKLVHDGEYDLLIVDIFMPGVDGLETMKLVHQCRPGLPVIVISGHAIPANGSSSPDFLMMATKLGAISSLQKPFKPAALLGCVTECLAASATSKLVMAPIQASEMRTGRL